jgi:hypothetical protein
VQNLVKLVMRTPAVAFAICALVASSAALGAQNWSDDSERVSRTLPLEAGGTLKLNTFSGRVTITTTDVSEVVVDAVRHGPRERLNRITLDIHGDSHAVVIEANHRERGWSMFSGSSVVDTDFDIKVPRRTNLDVNVFSASLTIDGVDGSQKLNGFSSRMTLNEVTGPLRAHTFSGSIIVRAKVWEPNQAVDLDTFSGNVELHLPETARGSVTFNSFSGHLDSDLPLTFRSSSGRRSLTAEVGGGGDAAVKVKTFSGNVRIDR